jgi:uracil-DNA glycosylase
LFNYNFYLKTNKFFIANAILSNPQNENDNNSPPTKEEIKYHNIALQNNVAKIHSWNNKYLFPLYHPSPWAMNRHRNLEKQMSDYKKLSTIVDPITGIKEGELP